MDLLLAEKIASQVYGQTLWQARMAGGAILAEFGKPVLPEPGSYRSRLRRREARGEWHLEVYAPWEVLQDGRGLAHNASLAKSRKDALAAMEEQALTGIRINPYSAETVFAFSYGTSLATSAFGGSGEPRVPWRLYTPMGYVLAVRDDGTFSYAPGEEAAEAVWYTLAPAR